MFYFDKIMAGDIAVEYGKDVVEKVDGLSELIKEYGVKKLERKIRMYNSLSPRTEQALRLLKEYDPVLYEKLEKVGRDIKKWSEELSNSPSNQKIPKS
ncbi:MAG: hypothetical protein IB618_02010 [Candidatus Pacearchaeota archaeon]|nr:MAG: hypothetical protein IB618_02010 [Candidatus Pacearchaeota archaeon]